ncbi:MAG: 2OG-Fe(II) oxygenase [Gammaproteobacteria bacterium]|nr:2OG-Fe(II) oxygenase [Gammaproteobacteria bacterium]
MQIINALDTEALHQKYQNTGFVIIHDLLCDAVAEAAYHSLKNSVPWEFHYRAFKSGDNVGILAPEQYASMSEKEALKLVPKIATLKDNDFTFAYCRYTIPTTLENTPENLYILTEIYRYFNSQEYLALMGKITGNDSGKEVSTWASRYDRHHHLSIHMDESPGQGRIAAHVLGLSKDWKKEWEGCFAFCNSKGKPVHRVPPRFNTLILFKVPRLHLVTPVKPYAGASRYSLFGWYKSTQQYFSGA